jgi:hypothetical protein
LAISREASPRLLRIRSRRIFRNKPGFPTHIAHHVGLIPRAPFDEAERRRSPLNADVSYSITLSPLSNIARVSLLIEAM